ncbi:hypothetical protein FIBSPDRAFT_864668 [Athelia psychrophila]|uniref:Uncharacterized protein n=1 Tax=Athelia psychrophila TaxID=1759441 RepID=A0A166GBT5_9AGAM|nr:hypothetical protein FIBSPDRAFT_873299 [Fibularhizoctonia sp. CBS 109695]KZP17677.1 hypothetical protein FIBSPDRAFT_864668 [Fibularhizoctonia sp. CBS 109695]
MPVSTSQLPEDAHCSSRQWRGIINSNNTLAKHCARCHRTYTIERTIHDPQNPCVVPHVYVRTLKKIPGIAEPQYVSLCCSTDALVERGEKSGGYCFVGQHTEDEEAVDYNETSVVGCYENNRYECLQTCLAATHKKIVWKDSCIRYGVE